MAAALIRMRYSPVFGQLFSPMPEAAELRRLP
jgi:hypothetical protein